MTETLQTTAIPEAPPEVAELLEVRTPVNFDDPHDVADALTSVPMLNEADLSGNNPDGTWVVETLGSSDLDQDNVSVPMSRVVGIENFQTWAGREIGKDGSIVKEHDNFSSLASIRAIAENPDVVDTEYNRASAIFMQAFEDSDGETWCMVTTDGSHRTAAAKLKGDATVGGVYLSDGTQRMKVNFSVRERLAAQKQLLESPEGKAAQAAYAADYVEKSLAIDVIAEAEQATRKAAEEKYLADLALRESVEQPSDDDWN